MCNVNAQLDIHSRLRQSLVTGLSTILPKGHEARCSKDAQHQEAKSNSRILYCERATNILGALMKGKGAL